MSSVWRRRQLLEAQWLATHGDVMRLTVTALATIATQAPSPSPAPAPSQNSLACSSSPLRQSTLMGSGSMLPSRKKGRRASCSSLVTSGLRGDTSMLTEWEATTEWGVDVLPEADGSAHSSRAWMLR
jgi:hypothetical protein